MHLNSLHIAERKFSRVYLGFAVFGIIITILGFTPTYFRPLVEAKSFDIIYHLHGFFCALWLILFLIQTCLINTKNIKFHIKIGVLGVFVVLGMVITLQCVGFITATREIASGIGLGEQTFFGNVVDSLTIGTLITIALIKRRQKDIHKRLMLLATIILLWVSWVRLRYYFPPFEGNFDFFGFILAMSPIPFFWLVEWYLFKRIHPIMFGAGCIVILEQGLQVAAPYLGYSETLKALATYLYQNVKHLLNI